MTQSIAKMFRQELAKKNAMYQKIGIKRTILRPYIQTSYEPDDHSKEILKHADFRKGFLHKIYKKDVNNVAILGPQGRGKTNLFDLAIEFSKILNVPFSWGSNLYVGEKVMIQRKKLVAKHIPGEQVLVDEASFLMRPNSVQKRDFIWTLASIRDAGLSIWVNYPTQKDFDWSIIIAHFDWLFFVSYRDQEKRIVKYKIFYRVTFENQFHPPEFVEYPYKGATFWQPFLEQSVYNEYRAIKNTIYDEGVEDSWYTEKKQYDRKVSDSQKQKKTEDFLLKVEEITNSNLPKDSKIVELYKIGYPKYKMVKKLKTSMPTINSVLDELTISEIKTSRDIFVSTKRENIEEEMEENMDPDYDDFWPVSTFPKDILFGESRLYLTVGQEMVASFIIEGKDEREWRGSIKKVLLLKKESVRRESGMVEKNPAPMGGYSYI